jgi:hypothetical protein
LHKVMDGATAAPGFRAAAEARRAHACSVPPTAAVPPARRRTDERQAPCANAEFPHADPAVLQRFPGADGVIYAHFITALPAGDRAAVNAYLLSQEAPARDVVTAIANAQLAAARGCSPCRPHDAGVWHAAPPRGRRPWSAAPQGRLPGTHAGVPHPPQRHGRGR